MSDIAKINRAQFKRDIARIGKTLDNVERVLKKDVSHIIRQTAIFAIQSATKATEPGKQSKVSKLPKKFKFRALVKIPDSAGYYYQTEDGKIFKAKGKIRTSGKTIKRVTKGIKAWSKKQKKFIYIPYAGTKRDESDKRFKIPFYGAAKAGWLLSYKKLSKKSIDIADNRQGRKKYNRVKVRSDLVEVTNLVSYASKTSPNAARIGLSKASNRLEKSWMPKVERKLERDWKKRPKTFLQSLGELR